MLHVGAHSSLRSLLWTTAIFLKCAHNHAAFGSPLPSLSSSVDDRTGWKVYNVTPSSRPQLRLLRKFNDEGAALVNGNPIECDFWRPPSFVGYSCQLMVGPTGQQKIESIFRQHNISFSVVVDDVQSGIDEEIESNRPDEDPESYPLFRYSATNVGNFQIDKYHSYKEMITFLKQLNAQYPSLTSVVNIGTSYEGRPLLGLKVGKAADPGDLQKPAIVIDSGMHAREWIGPATNLYMLDDILGKYNSDDTTRELVDKLDWYFFPSLNPDGYMYSRQKDRLWRKTRSPNNCDYRGQCHYGVDPNRNFDFAYGGAGSSPNPRSESYRGDAPFTEPETKAISTFLLQNKDTIKAYITLHAYGQLWLLPFAHERGSRPSDYQDLLDVANEAVEALRRVYGNQYRVGTSPDLLYVANGIASDWAKGVAGIKYSYTIELRPTWPSFTVKANQIVASGAETFAGIKVVAKRVLDEWTANLPPTAPTGNGYSNATEWEYYWDYGSGQAPAPAAPPPPASAPQSRSLSGQGTLAKNKALTLW